MIYLGYAVNGIEEKDNINYDRHDQIESQFLNVSNNYDRVRNLKHEIQQNEEKVVQSIEEEIKTKEHTIKTISGILDAIQESTRSGTFTQQRQQLRKMKITNINRLNNQGPKLAVRHKKIALRQLGTT
ncbi:hypothetical protein [Priestia megaterium]|uniref:hypothetical protein n=1 Tax=Priestia megaterium TaxID=1404 RepID=UPI002EB4AA13|nr:hypothetical protein [Priestia megaterium]